MKVVISGKYFLKILEAIDKKERDRERERERTKGKKKINNKLITSNNLIEKQQKSLEQQVAVQYDLA